VTQAVVSTSGWTSTVNLGAGPLGSDPTAGVDGTGGEYVFWRGTNGALWDKWYVDGSWHGPGAITNAGTQVASPPSVAVHANGQQDVFWKGTDGDLWEISHGVSSSPTSGSSQTRAADTVP
jgi:hypothetical protein